MSNKLTFALVGNPNCGKTTIFNALTGSKQHVGNWPGVTVEKKEGRLVSDGEEITVVDLPGTYSMGAYSEDEVVARDFILDGNPDVVINIVDSTNIERNLYLTTQLLEMDANVVVVLNMIDEAERKKIQIDIDKLSKKLGVPVVTTVGNKNKGIKDLIKCAVNTAKKKKDEFFKIDYGKEIENEIALLNNALKNSTILLPYSKNWVAIKLLENDVHISNKVFKDNEQVKLKSLLEDSVKRLTNEIGYEPDSYIIDKRYDFISQIANDSVKKEKSSTKLSTSDKIDKVVTNKYLGIPIFAIIMFLMYQITISFGNDVLGDGIVDAAFGNLGEWAEGALANSPEILRSFIVDGIIGGLGSVFVFIPLLFTMYFIISLLEDSGYMARAAYVMDRFMSSIGLHGKTAVSLIIGSGCNVAGIMSTRTLESKKDRMIAILINPFISCGARLPVYILFISAFFADRKVGIFSLGGLMVFGLYVLGIIVAILTAKVFSKTLFKGDDSYFVMELPPYRIPTLKGVLIHMWEKSEAFIKKAGTIIFSIVVLVWALTNLPAGCDPENSILAMIGKAIAPIFKPAGFGNWQSGVALVTGLGAKEAVIATMATIFGVAEEGVEITNAIQSLFTPLSAISFMVFSLLYAPCCAAIGAVKRETNSAKWAWFVVIYTTALAWVVSVLIYQVGRLMGFN